MKKQLIPAIAMALLGATALGGSTFAWFSANSTAAATGLSIGAKASSSLLISNTSGSGWAGSTTLSAKNTVADEIQPCTIDTASVVTTGLEFKRLTETDKQHVLPTGAIDSSYTAQYEATTEDYIKTQVYLLYSGANEEKAKVDWTCTLSMENNADAIWQAIHVALYDENTKTLVSDLTWSTLGAAVDGTQFEVTSAAQKGFDIYVWVEGTSQYCKNSNALNEDSYSIDFSFTLHQEQKTA